jgi:hypothetical protein
MTKNAVLILSLLALFSIASSSRAEDTSARRSIATASAARGVGADVLPALRRLPGPGAQPRLDALLAVLPEVARMDGSCERRDAEGRIALHSSTGWLLTVDADGDEFDYRDERLANAPVWDRAPPMALDELIGVATSLASGALAPLIALGREQALVPLSARREVRAVRDATGQLVAETVSVNELEYARTVRGVPGFGRGSRLRIGVSPNGELVSIEARWSALEADDSRPLAVVPLGQPVAREARLRANHGVPGDMPRRTFECGYLDSGDGMFVQLGCRSTFRIPHETTTYAKDFWIPAAKAPLSDAGWLEIAESAGGGP